MKLDSTDERILKFLQSSPEWFTRREIAQAIGQRQLSNRRVDTLKYYQSTGQIFEWVGCVVSETAALYRVLYRGWNEGDENGISTLVNRPDGLKWVCRDVWWKRPLEWYE